MLWKDKIDFGFISHEVRPICLFQPRHIPQVTRRPLCARSRYRSKYRAAFLSPLLVPSTPDGSDGKSLPKGTAAWRSRLENKGEQRISEYRYGETQSEENSHTRRHLFQEFGFGRPVGRQS